MTRTSCQYRALVELGAADRLEDLHSRFLAALADGFPGAALRLLNHVEHHGYWRELARFEQRSGEVRVLRENLRDLAPEERATRLALGERLAPVCAQGSRDAGLLDGAQVLCLEPDAQTRLVALSETSAPWRYGAASLDALCRLYETQYRKIHHGLHDALTGLLGRATFEEDVMRVFAEVQRGSGEGVWGLALIDVDHFKSINDRYGHLYGDEVLVALAHLMRSRFRESDALFRYGGEEFAVLLHARDAQAVHDTLERFREATSAMRISRVEQVTVSIGFLLIDGKIGHCSALVDCADKALYYAKANGRNQARAYEALVASGAIAPVMAVESEVDLF